MKRDDLRILAGIPTKNDENGRKSLAETGEEHHHFGLEDEGNVAKTCIALAKAGLTVDMEFAMGIFYFNFKTKVALDKAAAVMERVIDKSKEQE